MGARTRTAKYAVGFTFGAFLFIVIAFSTPYWLVNDGVLRNPKFLNLGKQFRVWFKKLISFKHIVLCFRTLGTVPSKLSRHPQILRYNVRRLHVDLWRGILHNPWLHTSTVLYNDPVLLYTRIHLTAYIDSNDFTVPRVLQRSRTIYPSAHHKRQLLSRRWILCSLCCNIIRLLWRFPWLDAELGA